MGVGGQLHAPAALTPGKRTGTHCTGGCVIRGSLWLGTEYLACTGILSADRPAQSESLHILIYLCICIWAFITHPQALSSFNNTPTADAQNPPTVHK